MHADICYSDVGAPDKRGRAVTEVLVAGPTLARAGRTVVHGVLADGRAYRASLPDDPFVGKADADGFVVRARMVDGGDGGGGGVYLLTRTRNRREERRFVAFAEYRNAGGAASRGGRAPSSCERGETPFGAHGRRRPLARQHQQLAVRLGELLRPHGVDAGSHSGAVLDDGHAGGARATGEDLIGDRAQDLGKAEVLDGAVVNGSAVELAQPDQQHLE